MTESAAAATETERPCAACPWVSTDARDRAAVEKPETQAAMQAGTWFCCHVNMGTCHGARLLHEKHLRKTSPAAASQ